LIEARCQYCGDSRVPGDDAVERRSALGEHISDVELHLLQDLGEKDVEPAPTVDEYLVEWKPPWFREACPLLRAGEGYGYLRPLERGRDRWFDVQDFPSGGLLRPSGG
jgi:hypothetical protein